MRADGKRVKGLAPLVSAIPYIMGKRVDAQNSITEYANMEPIKEFIREQRRQGHRLNHMSVVLACYYKAALQHPYINRFIMNHHVFERNHFCVSFVLLKKVDGEEVETTLKVYFTPEDDVYTISKKIEDVIQTNSKETHSNSTDKFAKFMFSIPLLPNLVVGLASLLDKFGLLPRKLIDLSPFHTSLFITNLASINTSFIYHHCYEFGTTSVFISMGKPVANFVDGKYEESILPLGIVMDERICTGHQYAQFCFTFRKYLKHPELLLEKETEENKEEGVEA